MITFIIFTLLVNSMVMAADNSSLLDAPTYVKCRCHDKAAHYSCCPQTNIEWCEIQPKEVKDFTACCKRFGSETSCKDYHIPI